MIEEEKRKEQLRKLRRNYEWLDKMLEKNKEKD